MCYRLCRIKNLTSANADDKIALFFFHDFNQTVDLIFTAFAVKIVKLCATLTLFKALLKLCTDSLIATLTDENQCLFSVCLCVSSEFFHFSRSLNIFGRADQYSCHYCLLSYAAAIHPKYLPFVPDDFSRLCIRSTTS